jgi:hypothetical protein
MCQPQHILFFFSPEYLIIAKHTPIASLRDHSIKKKKKEEEKEEESFMR